MQDGVSIYFYAGDFVEAARRYKEGIPQAYATHDEVMRTCFKIGKLGIPVDIYSYYGAEAGRIAVGDGVRVINIGGTHYRDKRLLASFASDANRSVIAHFASVDLYRAINRTDKKAFAVLASSFNERGLKPTANRYLYRTLLNRRRFDFVANHCEPSTKLLRSIGVNADKLMPWNIPIRWDPNDLPPKQRVGGSAFELCYVGSVTESKGVGDLIRGVAQLRRVGKPVHCRIVGKGEIGEMKALADSLGVAEAVDFVGLLDNEAAFATMRASDAVVVPSRREFQEGFPLVLFEAIASRVPIVCSDHPIFREAFDDRRNAMMFRERDHVALAESVGALMADVGLYDRLSAASIQTWAALSRCADWSTMITEWVTLGKASSYLQRNTLAARTAARFHLAPEAASRPAAVGSGGTYAA